MLLKKKTIPKYIIDDVEISSDSDVENSEEEILIFENFWRWRKFWWGNSDKKNSNEKNSDEEN